MIITHSPDEYVYCWNGNTGKYRGMWIVDLKRRNTRRKFETREAANAYAWRVMERYKRMLDANRR